MSSPSDQPAAPRRGSVSRRCALTRSGNSPNIAVQPPPLTSPPNVALSRPLEICRNSPGAGCAQAFSASPPAHVLLPSRAPPPMSLAPLAIVRMTSSTLPIDAAAEHIADVMMAVTSRGDHSFHYALRSFAQVSRACLAAVERAYAREVVSRHPCCGEAIVSRAKKFLNESSSKKPESGIAGNLGEISRKICSASDVIGGISMRQEFARLSSIGRFGPCGEVFVDRDYEFRATTSLDAPDTTLIKVNDYFDSDNVFVKTDVMPGQCAFVEMAAMRVLDDSTCGVSHSREQATQLSGWANVRSPVLWSYCKVKNFKALQCGGKEIEEVTEGYKDGDTIAIYVDADKRQVVWYKNHQEVARTKEGYMLPDPEPDHGYGIFAMIDKCGDQWTITDWGYRPYM